MDRNILSSVSIGCQVDAESWEVDITGVKSQQHFVETGCNWIN